MDLRTNMIDLGLATSRPGATDRVLALGEALLAYCDSQVLKDQGERLVVAPLLTKEELTSDKLALDEDPDSPQQALSEQDELESEEESPDQLVEGETGGLFSPELMETESAAAPADHVKVGMTPKTLSRKATQRFTALMAATHGYGATPARSKRFAGVIDAGMWWYKNGAKGVRAEALMILGGQHPADRELAALLDPEHVTSLDTPEKRRRWLENESGINNWGATGRQKGKHVSARIKLQQLLELALRVYVRSHGLEEDAADDEVGLLLGNMLVLVASLKEGKLKGYRVELSVDDKGILSVRTPKTVQRLNERIVDALGSVRGDYPDLPLLECQALSPERRMDATRFGNQMDFFVAVKSGAESTREKRIAASLARQKDGSKAWEYERKHCKKLLRSGLVLKNRAQDLVEHCLDAVVGTDSWSPIRFQPTEGRNVMVQARSSERVPQFLLEPLPRLQILYCREIREDAHFEAIHASLIRALAGVVEGEPSQAGSSSMGAEQVDLLCSWEQVDTTHPVLVVQAPTAVRSKRGATVSASAWFSTGGEGPRRLTGDVTAQALAARERAEQRGLSWEADLYTRAKMALYGAGKANWFAMQGLDLEPEDLEQLRQGEYLSLSHWRDLPKDMKSSLGKRAASRIEGFLHKLANIRDELKYKHRLSRADSFPLGEAWREASVTDRDTRHFVCLYGRSPKAAPARVGVLEYALSGGVLHTGEMAIGGCRLPEEERIALQKPRLVRDRQLESAYRSALKACEGDWAENLEWMICSLVEAGRPLNDVLMVYSPDDGMLLLEQTQDRESALLGATWRNFPFKRILRYGPVAEGGTQYPNLARSNQGENIAVAQQLTPPPSGHDILLEPDGTVVRGIRAFRGAQDSEKRNNPLITWEVLRREPGQKTLQPVVNPETTPVFGSFIDTLTDNLIKQGKVSRTPLPGKLVKILVKN